MLSWIFCEPAEPPLLSNPLVLWVLLLCAFLWGRRMSFGPAFLMRQDGRAKDGHIRLQHERLPISAIRQRARAFFELHNQRRSVRFFSPDPVPIDVLQDIVRAAGTAPSGAHTQPWHFSIVVDPELKRQIREEVEKEEKLNYERRMRKSWVSDVNHLVNNLSSGSEQWVKPYLEVAPALVVVFKQPFGLDEAGERIEHYYPTESVGIACGMLLTAITNANLVTLTSTPMGAERAIRNILGRPEHEKVFLLCPVGFPARDATVPYRTAKPEKGHEALRKPFEKIAEVK